MSKLGRNIARMWLFSVQRITSIQRVKEEDEEKAKEIIKTYTDKDFSYTDATSFTMMERLSLITVWAVDKDFVQYGKFKVRPLNEK